MNTFWNVVIGVVVLLAVSTLVSVAGRGVRDVSALETIQGIPYPNVEDATTISESLAHADIYLKEPVVFKQLNLHVRFHPGNAQKLSVGVRENDFWLSYSKVTLWETGDALEWQEKTISIPLTDKFQETDRSLDLMFFAETDTPVALDAGVNHNATWEISEIQTKTEYVWPTTAQLKDYVRSVVKKERAL